MKRRRTDSQEQEEDIEEESQIDSSMPLYLDHLFGTSVGGTTVGMNQVSSLGGVLPSSRSIQISAIPESQGFNVVGSCGIVRMDTVTSTSTLDLVDVQELLETHEHVSARQRTPPEVCSVQHSLPLFHSPEEGEQKAMGAVDDDVNKSGCKKQKCDSTNCLKQKPIKKEAAGRKRKCRSESMEGGGYEHPPGCTVLRDCVEADKIVDVLAIVLQGQLSHQLQMKFIVSCQLIVVCCLFLVNSPMDILCKRGLAVRPLTPCSVSVVTCFCRQVRISSCRQFCWETQPSPISSSLCGEKQLLGLRDYL